MPSPLPDLETMGLEYLRRRSSARDARVGDSASGLSDPVHVLNPAELAALRRIEIGVVLRAGVAGALSAAVSATAEVVAAGPGGDLDAAGWAFVIGITLAATTVEIAFLYWDALRSVHDLACAAGVRLFAQGEAIGTAQALARAALELPNRVDPGLGIDPHREASKLALLGAAVLYKVKIGLTNFLVKLAIRRLLGRAVVRSWLPFVAVPITAIWNAWVARMVIHEARLRAMGPSAAQARIEALFGTRDLSQAGREAALRAVGYAVVGKRDLHPNLGALLVLLRQHLGGPGPALLDDRAVFLRELPALPPDERDLVLALLSLALVLDGRLSARERALWQAAQQAAGLPHDERGIRQLRRAFVTGRPLD